MLRKPIITFLGHVDHGKSSLIERISHATITKGEAGLITQGIHSYLVPMDAVLKLADALVKDAAQVKIPGFLLIDSPGHAAFNNLRKRGGNLADIAVLVVDLNQGMQDQTLECLEILKSYKTPFVIVANKVDLIPGWQSGSASFIASLARQRAEVVQELDKRLYNMVAKLSEFGLNAERFDRVDDFAKQIALVPCSAVTGEGLPELLMTITGLAQRFLSEKLEIDIVAAGKGTVLEVKDEKGVGTTLDVVLYDGCLKVGDQLVVGGLDKPVVSRVKGLLDYVGKKLVRIHEVSAACGVRIVLPDASAIVGGMPLRVANKDVETVMLEVQEEVDQVMLEIDAEGIVAKADTLGSLEALLGLLHKAGLLVKRAAIGAVTKKDVAEALSERDPLNRVVVGFNVATVPADVKVITNQVIYKIIEDVAVWRVEVQKQLEAKELEKVARAGKFLVVPGCIFRQSSPAVVGIRVLSGLVRAGGSVMKKDGTKLGALKSLQVRNETVVEVKKDDEAAVSLPDVVVGRQLLENDIVYTDIPEADFVKLKRLRKYLKEDEIVVLKEIAEVKRKENPVWGV